MDKVFVGSGKVIDLDLSNFDANRMGRQVADALKADTRHHVPAREEIIGLDWSRGLKRPLDKFHDALSAALDVFTGEASVWASLEMMRQGIEEGSMKR
ncbi:MAG: hypothetical protein GWO24_32450, partial [Akkermansiaceae bacterium]|nr:hypothetical protein [Akkermansiaceae bacterium]